MSQQTTFDRTLVFEPFESQAGIPDTTLIGGTVYGDSLDGNGYCARYILHSGGGYIMHFGVFTYSGSPAISGEGLSFFGCATLNFEDDGNGLGVDILFNATGRTISKPIGLFSTPEGRAYASILEFRPITNQPTLLLISGQRPGVVTCDIMINSQVVGDLTLRTGSAPGERGFQMRYNTGPINEELARYLLLVCYTFLKSLRI